jgi:hypothetical protein
MKEKVCPMRKPADFSAESDPCLRLDDPCAPARRRFLKGSLCSLLLPALSAPWLVSCGEGPFAPLPTPRLTSVNNFRDVAGADDEGAYRTSKVAPTGSVSVSPRQSMPSWRVSFSLEAQTNCWLNPE